MLGNSIQNKFTDFIETLGFKLNFTTPNETKQYVLNNVKIELNIQNTFLTMVDEDTLEDFVGFMASDKDLKDFKECSIIKRIVRKEKINKLLN